VENTNQLLRRIEQARLWAYFHKDWLLAMRSLLRTKLPSEYHLFVESEAILISPLDGLPPNPILPDAAVTRAPTAHSTPQTTFSLGGTAAVVEVEEPCEIETHYSLTIRRAPENHVVAVLEVLSPSNKGVGNRLDEEKHLRKRDALIGAGIQLMEIDALVEGHRDLPAALTEKLSPFARVAWTANYFEGVRKYRGWGWNERDSLPVIPWRIDDNLEVCIDLPESAAQAFEFNHWSELVASAEVGGG
jgi:hypothetical protein